MESASFLEFGVWNSVLQLTLRAFPSNTPTAEIRLNFHCASGGLSLTVMIIHRVKLKKKKLPMNTKLTRRSFLKSTALTAGVFSAAPFNILTAANAGDKVRCVQIGCGGRA